MAFSRTMPPIDPVGSRAAAVSRTVPDRVTLRDLADVLGVSTMTVSLALRNNPRISPARRELIQATARNLGYQTNAMAAGLSQQRNRSTVHPVKAELAWINNWQSPQSLRQLKEFDAYWRGASQAARTLGFCLEEFVVGPGNLSYARLQKILAARNINGVLIPPHGAAAVTCPDKTSMDWSRYSIIRFGYTLPNLPANVVAGNQIQANLLAFSKIFERGYKRIGYVCDRYATTRNKAAHLFFLTGLPASQRPQINIFEFDHARRKSEQLRLGRWIVKHKLDAILTELAEMRAMLHQLGCRVPEDIGLASTSVLDGNADAGVVQNSEEIGKVAVETLVSYIYHNQTGLPTLYREVLVASSWQDGSTLPDRNRSVSPVGYPPKAASLAVK